MYLTEGILEKGPTHPQQNQRVETKQFGLFEEASAYKKSQLAGGAFSKVKVIARPNGKYDVASYIPLINEN